jgi:hypothetical protein
VRLLLVVLETTPKERDLIHFTQLQDGKASPAMCMHVKLFTWRPNLDYCYLTFFLPRKMQSDVVPVILIMNDRTRNARRLSPMGSFSVMVTPSPLNT